MSYRIIAAVLLSWVLVGSARADMYPDASNSVHPQALNNLFTMTPGSMANTGSGWWNTQLWGGAPGTNANWQIGSLASPITAAGPPVSIAVVTEKAVETCVNTANTGCNAALLVQNMGKADTTMVTSGITSYVETLSTSGLGVGNAQAGNFIAVASTAAQTGGLGLYSVGMRFGNLGSAYGAEISAWNRTLFNCSPADYYRLSRCVALYIAPRGPDQNADGTPYTGGPMNISSMLQLILGNGSGRAREGITINNGVVDEKTINDKSESVTSINIGGSHTHGIFIEAPSVEPQVGFPDHVYNSVLTNSFNDQSNSARSINIGGTPIAPEILAHREAAIWIRQSAGFFGLNVSVPPVALFHMGGTISLPAYTTDGAIIRQALGGVTDTTSPTGVVGGYNVLNMFEATQMNATNPGVTYNIAATMHVKAPLAGTNVTISNPYALIAGGAVSIDGSVYMDDLRLNRNTAANAFVAVDRGASLPSMTAPRMIYVGDSLTFSQYDRFITLPDYKSRKFSSQNIGIGGMKVTDWQTNQRTWLDPLHQYRSLENIAMIWLGTNDIALVPAETPASVWANLQALVTSVKAQGFKVCVGTMISRGAPAGTDTELAALNSLIVAGYVGAGINCLVNFGADPNLAPDGSNYSDTTYYSTDLVHLNEAGQVLAASIAQTALTTYINGLPLTQVAVGFPVLRVTGPVTMTTLPTSAGAGGLYACVDTAGVMYRKASCP